MTVINFYSGLQIESSRLPHIKKFFLLVSVTASLGVLGFFKYYNFFIESLDVMLTPAGLSARSLHLDIVLPVGISFYTFQVMSYTVDIYRGEFKSTRNFCNFALFVSFFPQLVAGPIERARRLLPHIERKRDLDTRKMEIGFWLILWGLYKKVAIADNMALWVDQIYAGSGAVTLMGAYLGTLAFAVQIYCDFSGYTDIARGCAKILGFELIRNFDLPYFSTNPGEFWKRWHISLSTWLRDYLYISLGGNRRGRLRTYLNLFLTMTLGGLWHGASWNFVLWGCYHGLLLIGHRLYTEIRQPIQTLTPAFSGFLKGMIMFQFTLFGWMLFRSNRLVLKNGWLQDDSLHQVKELILSFSNGFGFDLAAVHLFLKIFLYTSPLIFIQYFQYRTKNDYFMLELQPLLPKAVLYGVLIFTGLIWGVQHGHSFIYFQF